ncbi:MAG: MarR family transcriptional regulator [Pseudomonadota bacterium]
MEAPIGAPEGAPHELGAGPDQSLDLMFGFFNEVGIINQLSSTLFNRRMPHGLHVSHFSVLNHLVRLGDGVTPNKLAGAFQVTKATMTHTLAVLSKGGFLRMEPNPADARSKLVYLTDEGRALRDEAIETLREPAQKLAALMDMEAVAKALPTLQNARKTLDDNRDI